MSREGQRIAVLGVENWGKGFIQRGDLKQALEGVPKSDFKILLSHDPTHWQYQVIENPTFIHFNFKWSYSRNAIWNRNSWDN